MESKKAEEYLKAVEMSCDEATKKGYAYLITSYDAKQAIKMTEQEMEEKAIEAYRRSCAYNRNGYCIVSRIIDEGGYPAENSCGERCEEIARFLAALKSE